VVPPALAATRPLWVPSPVPVAGPLVLCTWRPTSLAEVGAHRRQLRRLLAAAGADGAHDDAVHGLSLVFEELATNAVRHGGSPVEVTVTAADPGWLVVASDAASGRVPVPAIGRDPACGGLGLPIVARLSRACGWHVDGGRLCVWAWIDPTLPSPLAAHDTGVAPADCVPAPRTGT
jgi:anti-sigma regulatory factor (Ser/Thr protein kinase)